MAYFTCCFCSTGPGGNAGKTIVKIINSSPVWKQVFEEQRKGVQPTYSDICIVGSDGHVNAHLIYLQHASDLINNHVTSQPPYVEPYSSNNVLTITLADVKVKHIRTVMTLLYSGSVVYNGGEWNNLAEIIKKLKINFHLQEEPYNSHRSTNGDHRALRSQHQVLVCMRAQPMRDEDESESDDIDDDKYATPMPVQPSRRRQKCLLPPRRLLGSAASAGTSFSSSTTTSFAKTASTS